MNRGRSRTITVPILGSSLNTPRVLKRSKTVGLGVLFISTPNSRLHVHVPPPGKRKTGVNNLVACRGLPARLYVPVKQ